jgi:hypothetical protein
MRTELDDYADRGREVIRAVARVVDGRCDRDLADPEHGKDVVFAALVAMLHYCEAAEVDFDRELVAARDLFKSESEMDDGLDGAA